MSRVLGGAALKRQLALLAKQSDGTIRDGLTRLSFAVKAGIERDLAQQLNYTSPQTRRFLAGMWKIRYRTSGTKFMSLIYPMGKQLQILSFHVDGTRVTAADKSDLIFAGKIAIPVSREIPVDSRGRVSTRWLPANMVKRNARGQNKAFLAASKNVILLRLPKGGVKPIYALKDSTMIPQSIDVQASAARVIEREAMQAFAAAMRKTMEKVGLRAGIRARLGGR